MTRADRLLVVLVSVLAVASYPLVAAARSDAGTVSIRGPQGVTTVESSVRSTLTVDGARGELVVEVADGRARVVAADCPDQICVRSGWSDAGRPIVCAPNRVVVESGGGGGLDAVSR